MYRISLVLGMIVALVCSNSYATENTPLKASQDSIISSYLLCMFSSKNSGTISKSGCCSWHGGVCGCSGSRQQCCDGSISPTCTCNSYIQNQIRGEQS